MKKEKNGNSLNKKNLKRKHSIKNGNNQRVNYINDNGNNIIGNILEVNKIKSNSIKTNQEKLDIIFNNTNSKQNLILNDYLQQSDFTYIKIQKTINKYDSKTISSLYNFNNYKIIINIIIDDDSLNSSKNLLKILKCIISSLNSLNKIKVDINNILVSIFFQHFTYEASFKYLFPELKFYNNIETSSNLNYKCSFGYFSEEKKLSILLFYKEASTFIEIYKFFYSYIILDLINLKQDKNKYILIINWPNGKIFGEEKEKSKIQKNKTGIGGGGTCNNFLKKIVNICGNRNIILIPDINFIPNEKEKNFGFVHQCCLDNDKIKINLNWYMILGYPIDHRFYIMNMNYELLNFLKKFYKNQISIFANENYHDYHLVIYLKKHMKNIEIEKIMDISVEYTDLPLNLKNYFHDLILRRGSEYVNWFDLMNYFISCEIFDHKRLFQKIIVFFVILSNFVQFFWLGITFLISYAVFNDTFGSEDNKMDYFCSLGYVIMTIILFSTSLLYIENKPKIKSNKYQRNLKLETDGYYLILVLYLIHYLYFFFSIICTIIALVHIKQGKYSDINDSRIYIFSTNFFIILCCINIFLFILPSLFRISNIFSKNFLYYLFFHMPNALAFFHYPYLFTCIKTVNSKRRKIESLYVICYVVLNGIVTVLCLVFDTTRQRRMNFFCVMAIIISVLNVIKVITSIISICLIKNFNKKYSDENNYENNYINDEQKSIQEKNDESFINKQNNESNTNYKLQTESNGLNLSENKDKNKEDILNSNISNFPMDTTEDNKDTSEDKEEMKKNIDIFNSGNNFLDNISQKQEMNPENNGQSFSVQNSSSNQENENNK